MSEQEPAKQAAAIVGVFAALFTTSHRLPGATQSAQLTVEQRRAEIAAAEAGAANEAPANPAPAAAAPDDAEPRE